MLGFSSSLSRAWLKMLCFSNSLSRAWLKMLCVSSSLSRAWLKMLCFSSSFSSACTKSYVFPVPFPFPSSLRGFPVFFQGTCVADFFLKKKKTFLFFSLKQMPFSWPPPPTDLIGEIPRGMVGLRLWGYGKIQGRAKICQNRPLQFGGFSPFKCSKGDCERLPL